MDGGAMFGVVPRVVWQRYHQSDQLNRIRLALRLLLIQDGNHNIIVDAGFGNAVNPTLAERVNLSDPNFNFTTALQPYQLTPEQITDVIITHLHFDHCGGVVTKKNNQWLPTFANAKIWLQREQFLWAQEPSSKDAGSFIANLTNMVAKLPGLALLQGPTNITPHVSLLCYQGHTPSQQTVLIQTEAGIAWYSADLVPTTTHLNLAWNMAYDNKPLETVEEKRQTLERAVQENWIIYFAHDAQTISGRLRRHENKFQLYDQTPAT
ncbi:MAG: MBL fold metallo-hydrolase [Sedimentisphaerales bacterium]|nr:MBL fold metallo-hydrolase [Sedimentisphaerales bacterium]